MFQRWLALFHGVTAGLGCPALQTQADAIAERIAAKLWSSWQQRQALPCLPDTLPEGVRPYRDSPVFTPDNLPASLQSAHATKAGTWGLLKVHAGVLRYTQDDPPHAQVVLAAGQQVLIDHAFMRKGIGQRRDATQPGGAHQRRHVVADDAPVQVAIGRRGGAVAHFQRAGFGGNRAGQQQRQQRRVVGRVANGEVHRQQVAIGVDRSAPARTPASTGLFLSGS